LLALQALVSSEVDWIVYEFPSDADEVFHYLQALDQKSNIFSLLPMAAYVVRADGVLVWYNARAAELWGRKQPSVIQTNVLRLSYPLPRGWFTHGAL